VARRTRVLIVDDDAASAHSLEDELNRGSCLCEIATSVDAVSDAVQNSAFDVVICDVASGGLLEFGLLEQVKVLRPNMPVILGSRATSILEAVEAVKRGAFQYLEKPFKIGELTEFIASAIADASRRRATTSPPSRSDAGVAQGTLVHASAIMRDLAQSIALVARSNAAVLLLGESGTGKERVARAIHEGGLRAGHPFVAVNTSAIPEQLLESEVFGHVRGAFTGASQARRGLLLEAHEGTLLLDEIGDMPLALQPKLLRVLQFGESRPVGSDRIGHVDVRIIAATHRDLNLLVREGRFREDLRYRLNVIPLIVPPLRERREDILPLVGQFLQEARARTLASPVDTISDEAMEMLTRAAWPGNVRELENTIERLVVLGRRSIVTAQDLAFLEQPTPTESWPPVDCAPISLKQMNQRYLDWVLAQTEGDKARAAGILKIDLSTLYRWERAKR
jgi:two-component system response regulator HydG